MVVQFWDIFCIVYFVDLCYIFVEFVGFDMMGWSIIIMFCVVGIEIIICYDVVGLVEVFIEVFVWFGFVIEILSFYQVSIGVGSDSEVIIFIEYCYGLCMGWVVGQDWLVFMVFFDVVMNVMVFGQEVSMW